MTTEAPTTAAPAYPFFGELARILNSGQSRSVILCGNVHDLFLAEADDDANGPEYVPLISFLCGRSRVPGLIVLVYELNGPIRVLGGDVEKLRNAWIAWQCGEAYDDLVLQSLADPRRQRDREHVAAEFDRHVRDAIGRPTVALEFLRQLAQCSRSTAPNGRPYLPENLLVFVEAADILVPAGRGDVTGLPASDRHRVTIMQDWLGDPGFMAGRDSVVLIAESGSLVHPRIAKLPSVLTVDVPAPDRDERLHFIRWMTARAEASAADTELRPDGASGPAAVPRLWSTDADLAWLTAGLSVHALRQLLIASAHRGTTLEPGDVVDKVQSFIARQLGEDVVEFKRPSHTLDDVVGFTTLKRFIADELLPRFRATGAAALPGAAVAGPIGGGKTFIFEAAAAALDLPVLVLKNIRSQWFGQTDVIFERLRRVLEALGKVVIFVDEADTQFGGVGPQTHDTERRLTGKIQQMMSDPRLRGKVIWLLMTARIHLLSPDIRRPGRVGDLIIPVLDPEGDDRAAFLRWTIDGALDTAGDVDPAVTARLLALTEGYSAAAFASLRSTLRARKEMKGRPLTIDEAEAEIRDCIPPAIGRTRRYQTLQAMVNCTRRSLLPDPEADDAAREAWQDEIRRLEAEGIS
jgi:hypothetical protein